MASVPPGGLLAALRALGATLNELLLVRGALAALELREELERRTHLLVLGGLAVVFLNMALALLALFLILFFWETHRLAAVGCIAALYLASGLAFLIRYRIKVATDPPPFAATLGELERDLEQLRGHP